MTDDELNRLQALCDANKAYGGGHYTTTEMSHVAALIAEVRRLRQECDRYDTRLTNVRLQLTAAGVPESGSYPEDPSLSHFDKTLRAGGFVIEQSERVLMLREDRDKLRAENASLKATLIQQTLIAEREG